MLRFRTKGAEEVFRVVVRPFCDDDTRERFDQVSTSDLVEVYL